MTYKLQSVLQNAVEQAQTYELQNIEIEAILISAMSETDSLYHNVLERANIDTEQLITQYVNKLKN